jgi:hypothetical protein
MSPRSPRYGLTESTRKPVRIACGALARAIGTLNAHHEDEETAFGEAVSGCIAKMDAAPEGDQELALRRVTQMERAAERLRGDRAVLLVGLLDLRPTLADVLIEERDLHVSTLFGADVESELTASPPKRLGGRDIPLGDRLYVLEATLRWTQQTSYGCVAVALGPAYLLSYVIEHPTPEASAFRKAVTEAQERLQTFLNTAHSA